MNIVDASGWIEFFLAGTNGPKFKPVIENTRELLVSSVNMYEVHRVLSRKLPVELRDMCLQVMRRAPVIELNDERAIAASELSLKHGLAMADAAMYAIALEHKAVLWTQDADYQGLKGVKYFPKD
jgi:predicted nucleic acid-binding protein